MKRRRLTTTAAILLGALVGGGCTLGCSRSDAGPDPYAAEVAQREAFVKAKLLEVDAGRAWSVSSNSEIQFDEGFSILSYDPPDQTKGPSFYNHAFRWMGQHAHVRLKTHDQHPMKLVIAGWVNENIIRTRPIIDLFVDGRYVETSNLIERHGHYSIETIIPSWMLSRPWVDLAIRTNAVAFHWADPPQLMVALVYRFSWTEAN